MPLVLEQRRQDATYIVIDDDQAHSSTSRPSTSQLSTFQPSSASSSGHNVANVTGSATNPRPSVEAEERLLDSPQSPCPLGKLLTMLASLVQNR